MFLKSNGNGIEDCHRIKPFSTSTSFRNCTDLGVPNLDNLKIWTDSASVMENTLVIEICTLENEKFNRVLILIFSNADQLRAAVESESKVDIFKSRN